MDQYKRVMVGLEMTDEDVPAIRYAAMMAKVMSFEKIYFLHIVRDLEIPESVKEEFPELKPPLDENLESRMRQMVSEHLDPNLGVEVMCEVHEGDTGDQLLHWLKVKEIDLVIVGGLGQAEGDGSVPIEMARKAPCSVLIVPPGSEPSIDRILVPIDFSPQSGAAVQVAAHLASKGSGTTTACGHVFDLPSGYYKTGKTEDEFGKVMRDHARKHFEKFIKDVDLCGQQVSFFTRRGENVSRALAKAVARRESNLVVIGARGRSSVAALVLGSVTEGLIRRLRIPVLAVKDKSESLGILEAILEL